MKPGSEPPAPPAPSAARGVFGARLESAVAYVELLAGAGTLRGLLGPREVPRLWERHVLNCAVLADLLPRRARVCDVGSGAGLPGIPVAIRRPDIEVVLLEPLLRRTRFLEEAVTALHLDNVSVVRGRAEELPGLAARDSELAGVLGVGFDVVTSRAVAPLDRLVRWSLPLVAPGGEMIAMKGSTAAEEVSDAAAAIRRAGGVRPRVERIGQQWVDPPVTVVRITRRS